jgi:hypothetical protein
LGAGAKAKSVTTASAEALAKAEQLTYIDHVSTSTLFYLFIGWFKEIRNLFLNP